MHLCNKCNSIMKTVDVIDINGKRHTSLVCTYEECGHIYSKDKLFKKAWKLPKERRETRVG